MSSDELPPVRGQSVLALANAFAGDEEPTLDAAREPAGDAPDRGLAGGTPDPGLAGDTPDRGLAGSASYHQLAGGTPDPGLAGDTPDPGLAGDTPYPGLDNDKDPIEPPRRHGATTAPAARSGGSKLKTPGGGGGLTLEEMHHKRDVGDFTGALAIAESILVENPAEERALRMKEACEGVLLQMYRARVGPLDRVPSVLVAREQLRWLSMDHRAGFVLSHVDGASSLETILDVSGMPLFDALRILDRLFEEGVIAIANS